MRYPDEILEHYADRFMRLRLARHGVNLEQYLANVERFEMLALCCEPLLPAQQAAALRLWQQQDTGLAPEAAKQEPALAPHDWQGPRELIARWRDENAERQVSQLPQRNGQIVEPLHHHRHPRRAGSGFIKKLINRGA